MFDIIELNGKKVAELKEITGKLSITRLDKLKKQDLVYSILDEQDDPPQGFQGKVQRHAGAKSQAKGESKQDDSGKPGASRVLANRRRPKERTTPRTKPSQALTQPKKARTKTEKRPTTAKDAGTVKA